MEQRGNTHELDVLTHDGLRLRVGPTGAEDLEQIIRAGGRRGDIYRRLKTLRDKYAPSSATASRNCRAVCQATTSAQLHGEAEEDCL
jgi:hypothetical protein